MPKVNVKVERLGIIKAKLDGTKLYDNQWREIYGKLVDYVAGNAEERAPKRTLKLASSVGKKLDPAPMPLWGKVTASAVSSRGFRYPFALEAGRRARSGKRTQTSLFGLRKRKITGKLSDESYVTLHRAGTQKGTRKWFSGSMRGFRKKAKQLLDWAAREVEHNWVR